MPEEMAAPGRCNVFPRLITRYANVGVHCLWRNWGHKNLCRAQKSGKGVSVLSRRPLIAVQWPTANAGFLDLTGPYRFRFMRRPKSTIYGDDDPLDIPAYGIAEAAHYLRVPLATLRTWCSGRWYSTARGRTFAEPLIELADAEASSLSFCSVVELHVLCAIRRTHKVNMPAIRRAIKYVQKNLQVARPLADQQMSTDGKDLFIEHYGKLLNISRGGQMEMKGIVSVYLERIDRDAHGVPVRLFPFTRTQIEQALKHVAMDPRVQFGRPCIFGTGIPTTIIAERYCAGDSIEVLVNDYDQEILAIEEAIRCEFDRRAA